MPEGPSIVILKESVQEFKGQKIIEATGNTKKINLDGLKGKTILDFKSWGKHFLICIEDYTLRIHFLLFGSYRINEHKASVPRLRLQFEEGELNFYACAIQPIKEPLENVYDWKVDVLSPLWNPEQAFNTLKAYSDMLACDALLDQNIFSGVGNIIKNEVLFRVQIHPESVVGRIPDEKLKELIYEASHYSYQFLDWKKEYTLKKHWLAHTKKICPRDGTPLYKQILGKTRRRTFFCNNCQILYL